MSDMQALRALETSALKQKVAESYQSLFKLNMQKATGVEIKTHRFKVLRREIARVLTVLQEKLKQRS